MVSKVLTSSVATNGVVPMKMENELLYAMALALNRVRVVNSSAAQTVTMPVRKNSGTR